MRDEPTARQRELVAEIDGVVAAADAGPREVLRRLGEQRLLAVHYPRGYGGRELTVADHLAVCERLGTWGLPDVPHLISVQAVGCSILVHGTDAQRERWLPELASGRVLASLLLSEPHAGSDLAGVATAAAPAPDGTGWRITGVKSWSLYTEWSELALCSVRTRDAGNRYAGISTMLVDLTAPGVTITPQPRSAGTPYRTVHLDDVRVGADAVLGPLHGGWPLLPDAIGFERAGLDYLTRAVAWLAAARNAAATLPRSRRDELAPDLVRLGMAVDNARAFAFHAANSARHLRMDDVAVAYAKLACSRAAQAVARWAGQELVPALGAGIDAPAAALLSAAVAEAPEFSISGGAQELQFDQIAVEHPIGRTVR